MILNEFNFKSFTKKPEVIDNAEILSNFSKILKNLKMTNSQVLKKNLLLINECNLPKAKAWLSGAKINSFSILFF